MSVTLADCSAFAASHGCLDGPLSEMTRLGLTLSQGDAHEMMTGILDGSLNSLCGHTCAVNLLEAIRIRSGASPASIDPISAILAIQKRSWPATPATARALDPTHLALSLQDAMIRARINAQVRFRIANRDRIGIEHLTVPDRAGIVAVEMFNERGLAVRGHYVIVRSVDPEKKVIRIQDPNFPDRNLELGYQVLPYPFEKTSPGWYLENSPVIELIWPGSPYEDKRTGPLRNLVDGLVYIDLPPTKGTQ